MRIPRSAFAPVKIALVLVAIVGSVLLSSSDTPAYTERDKAYYADQNLVNFVRPGLQLKILGAEIGTDGVMKVRFKMTDPRGLPLDREGITTPGAVNPSFVAAYIPKNATQYTAYTTRTQTSPITRVSAIQAGSDTGGRYEKLAEGDYVYTFGVKAPANHDRTATHSISIQGSRNLTEFDLGTQFDNDVFTFVPDGSKVAQMRDVVRTATCNSCHDQLAFHGGSRRKVEYCVMCHTPQTTDPDTGNTVDFPVMIHKIHAGKELPSVIAGGKYSIIGFGQNEIDYSTVGFPAGVTNCESCHKPGASTQANAYLKPNRAACGACHDDVKFATGENHVNLPQISDNSCGTCHQPQGELEFDASIKGAHTNPTRSSMLGGIVVDILKVEDGVAGRRPRVTFSVKDKAGNGLSMEEMRVPRNRVGLVLAGNTDDYGSASIGTAGYVSEDPTAAGRSTCSADGVCIFTFTQAIPADAKGTYSIGIEARRDALLLAGTKKEVATTYGAINKVVNFSVDGSTVKPRRQVVATAKCNGCHSALSLHGNNRNQVEQCVLCHNPRNTDILRRPIAQVMADRNQPPQAVNFAVMVHKIHTGEQMKEFGREYTVVGNGGSHNDFTEVRYPPFSNSGAVGDRTNCAMCHVNGSEGDLTKAKLMVTDPQGLLNPVGPITSACTGCHQSTAAASHALANTTEKLGESCDVCHGTNAEFSVSRVHAR